MKEQQMTVVTNLPLAARVFQLTLTGDALPPCRPGQFVNLKVENCFLRRPVSVADQEENTLRLIYKAVGRGTELLSRLVPGESLQVLMPLGNGYDLSRAGAAPLLLGGGVGAPPLYLLARRLRQQGLPVSVVLGFNTAGEVFGEADFQALGCEVTVTTVDGSHGCRGFVTDALRENYSFFYACGPLPMLKAVYRKTVTEGQFSLEERMGCGFGACMGCTCQTAGGPKRVCTEGPVFDKSDLLWE